MVDHRGGLIAVLIACDIKRNLAIGFGTGLLFAAALLYFFVIAPARTAQTPIFYFGLAAVVTTTVGGLLTTLLTLRRAIRLGRSTAADFQ